MLWPFRRKPDPSEAGRSLAKLGAYIRKENERALKRAMTEQIARDSGQPLPVWPS